MLSSRGDSKNLPSGENQGAMPKKAGGGTPRITIKHGANASEVASIAARELADGLAKMFAGEATPQPAAEIDSRAMLVSLGPDLPANPGPNTLTDDSFQISRPGKNTLAI